MQGPFFPTEITLKMLVPSRITGSYLSRLMQRALRNGAWRLLTPLEKAWLRAARLLPLLRSREARSIAQRIALKVELATTRGKAILLGALEALKRGLTELLRDYQALLTLGLDVLHRPVLYYTTHTPEEQIAMLLNQLTAATVVAV